MIDIKERLKHLNTKLPFIVFEFKFDFRVFQTKKSYIENVYFHNNIQQARSSFYVKKNATWSI